MELQSKLLENAVTQFASLPGIGKKTALRLVLNLLYRDKEEVAGFCKAMLDLRNEIHFCERCHNISDKEICSICANKSRNQRQICVVENIRDIIAIESTQQYNGLYHVLGGVISPLDGVGPEHLEIASLLKRVGQEETEELIFALNPNIQGDTTIFYIKKKLGVTPCVFTTIARGVAFGGELEYADEMTLAKSLANRIPVDRYVKS